MAYGHARPGRRLGLRERDALVEVWLEPFGRRPFRHRIGMETQDVAQRFPMAELVEAGICSDGQGGGRTGLQAEAADAGQPGMLMPDDGGMAGVLQSPGARFVAQVPGEDPLVGTVPAHHRPYEPVEEVLAEQPAPGGEMVDVDASVIEGLVVPAVEQHRHDAEAMVGEDPQRELEIPEEYRRIADIGVPGQPEPDGIHAREVPLPMGDLLRDHPAINPSPQLEP